MNLVKTSLLTAIATVARLVSGFVINKFVAIYVGPVGLATVGQLQNFNALVMTFAKGGISQGVVKYTAETNREDLHNKLFSTAVVICFACSILVALLVGVLSEEFARIILKDIAYKNVFKVLSVSIIFFSFNSLLLSILNGKKEIKKMVSVGIASSIWSLFFTSYLIVAYGLIGVLYAIVINQGVVLLITALFLTKTSWFKLAHFLKGMDREYLDKLSKFSLMAIVTAISVPVSHMLIRSHIGESLSWEDAGIWQGMWYVSTMYLLFITTSIGVYYTPKLSELKSRSELKKEVINGYKSILPVTIILAIIIYLLRFEVVQMVFSSAFLPMIDLFKWQLAGDVMKIASYLLSTMMLAKAMTKTYIYSDIFFSITFTLLSIFFINCYGLVGVVYAHVINYLFYFIFLVWIFRDFLYE